MSLVAEVNCLPELSLKIPQDSKLASAHPKADVSFGAAAEFFAVLLNPVPYKGTKGGQAMLRAEPAQPSLSFHSLQM